MHRILWALMFLALPGLSAAARAEEAPASAPVAQDPYLRLIAAMDGATDRDALQERVVGQLRESLLADPGIKGMERDYPGIVSQMIAAMRPIMLRQALQVEEVYRRRMRDLLPTRLNEREAGEAADFFGSPLGQRMLRVGTETFTMAGMLKEAVAGGETISAQAFDADMQRSRQRAAAALSEEDEREARRLLAGRIWFMQFRSLMPRIQELNLEIMNAPASPEEDAALEAAASGVIEKRMAAGTKPGAGKD